MTASPFQALRLPCGSIPDYKGHRIGLKHLELPLQLLALVRISPHAMHFCVGLWYCIYLPSTVEELLPHRRHADHATEMDMTIQ